MVIQEVFNALEIEVKVPDRYNVEVEIEGCPESSWLYHVLTEIVEIYTAKLNCTDKYHLYIDEGGMFGSMDIGCLRTRPDWVDERDENSYRFENHTDYGYVNASLVQTIIRDIVARWIFSGFKPTIISELFRRDLHVIP